MLTDEWRTEAFRRFPELQERFQDADNPYLLWFELRLAFAEAYRPRHNEDLIKRIYDYLQWCGSQPAGIDAKDDLGACIRVMFVEHIPEIPAAVKDMPRWFSRADVVRMKDDLSYIVGAVGYAKVLAQFDGSHQQKRIRSRSRSFWGRRCRVGERSPAEVQ